MSNQPGHSADAKHQANDRLVHALLLHVHDGAAVAHREERVRRVLQVISAGEIVPAGERGALVHPAVRTWRLARWALRTTLAAAAMLVIIVGIWVATANSKTAYASLNDILGALSKPGDRTYRLRVEPLDPRIQPMTNLNGAILALRDGRQYLLERPDRAGGMQYDGFDGRQSWRINSGRVVEIREGLGAGGLGISPVMSDALYENLQATMQLVGTAYTVEKFEQALKTPDGAVQSHVVARHKPGGGGRDEGGGGQGPPVIEIWADSKTGMPRRIIFQQDPYPRPSEMRRLVFDLLNESSLPADWFAPDPHITARGAAPRGAPDAPR
jgi:hypothetical protein